MNIVTVSFSGPRGSGKTTLSRELRRACKDMPGMTITKAPKSLDDEDTFEVEVRGVGAERSSGKDDVVRAIEERRPLDEPKTYTLTLTVEELAAVVAAGSFVNMAAERTGRTGPAYDATTSLVRKAVAAGAV